MRMHDLPLMDRLRGRIEAGGPITFAEFMEAALYDPNGGFFMGPVVGESGAFVTSPHLSPVFGQLVARQVEEFWMFLDRPDPFAVVEVGAGDGTLARRLLASFSGELKDAVRYTAVERGAQSQASLRSAGLRVVTGLDEVPRELIGCVLANELLDNLPFHWIRGTEEGPRELFVGLREGRLALLAGEPGEELVRSGLLADLPAGVERVVRPALGRFVEEVRGVLGRGYAWIVDYSSSRPEGEEASPSVHGYRSHRQVQDLLVDPGTSDITSGVDFGRVVDEARHRGMAVWGPTTQRDALLSLGFGELDASARAVQVEALELRRGTDALRAFSDRNRAGALISRGGLGDFLVVGLGVAVDPHRTPRSFR